MFSAIKNNKTIIVFLLILAAGSIIRLYNPTFRSLWGDEAHSIYSAAGFLDISALAKDSHLPAYFLLLSAWMNGFGAGEYGLRFLSIVLGILSIIAVFLFVRDVFGEKPALIASCLLAFSPLAVMHSHEIRVYGLMLLSSILSAWFFFRLLYKRFTAIDVAMFIVSTIILGMTHIYSSLLILSQMTVCCAGYLRKREARALYVLLFLLIVSALLTPFYFQIIVRGAGAAMSGTADMAFSAFPPALKLPLIFFVLSLGETAAPWNILVLPAALLFGFLAIYSFFSAKDEKLFGLLMLLFLPVIISSLLPSTMPKYLIFALPFYVVLLSLSLSHIKNKILFCAALLLAISLQGASVANYYSLREYHNSNQIEPWREVSSIIAKDYKQGDLIAASSRHITYRILKYYLGGGYQLASLIKENGYVASSELNAERIWLVTHIVDQRALPEGYIDGIKLGLSKKYKLKEVKTFVPYESTLVSKLPINRHRKGSFRITMSLYEKTG